jgi:hypothetical protein
MSPRTTAFDHLIAVVLCICTAWLSIVAAMQFWGATPVLLVCVFVTGAVELCVRYRRRPTPRVPVASPASAPPQQIRGGAVRNRTSSVVGALQAYNRAGTRDAREEAFFQFIVVNEKEVLLRALAGGRLPASRPTHTLDLSLTSCDPYNVSYISYLLWEGGVQEPSLSPLREVLPVLVVMFQ